MLSKGSSNVTRACSGDTATHTQRCALHSRAHVGLCSRSLCALLTSVDEFHTDTAFHFNNSWLQQQDWLCHMINRTGLASNTPSSCTCPGNLKSFTQRSKKLENGKQRALAHHQHHSMDRHQQAKDF